MKFHNRNSLALYGGAKIIKKKFKRYNSIGKEEIFAASKVIRSGKLSGFVAGDGKDSQGGYYINKFENYLKDFYKVKHAVTVNSWTSGLIAAIGAINVKPGDEIITTPWTMAATATSIIHWNAIPVFVDVDKKNFCISPKEIKKKITKKTVAILAVDIFGNACDIRGIKKVIKDTKIKIITDSAHSPYSVIKGKITGTQSHIGGFSLNCHKHINTGEGGIVVTNNSALARRARLLRNHAETSLKNKTKKQLSNMIGYNFRMGEVEAAIGIEQYKKIKQIIKSRNFLMNLLTLELSKLPGLIVPEITKDYDHNYYIYPLVLNFRIINYSRNFIYKCLKAEGVQGLNEGYANIHLLPMYQKKIAYGQNGFPWSTYNKKIDYKKGICPIAEELHDKSFLGLEVCLFQLSKSDILNIASAFKKVWRVLKIF